MICKKTVELLLCIVYTSGIANLVAEGGVSEAGPGWLSVVIQTGSFGLIAYLIVRGLPVLQKEIMTERQMERADFIKSIESGRVEFTKSIEALTADRKIERQDYAASLKNIMDYSRAEAEAIRSAAHQEMESLRKTFRQEQRETRATYTEMVNAMRTAVHDVRDVASVTMRKAELATHLIQGQQEKGHT